MAQYLTGEKLGALSARTRTFITERPLPTGPAVSLGGQGGSTLGEVTVDDAAVMHGELGPVLATFEATRMATSRKNALELRRRLAGTTGAGGGRGKCRQRRPLDRGRSGVAARRSLRPGDEMPHN
jgi:hypothetical protein